MATKTTSDNLSTPARPQTMADLMAKQKSVVSLKKGELIEGKITKLTSHEILVDIQGKTEAVVLEKEKKLLKSMLSTLKVGDTVTVSVLNPESDFGYPVVSLRRFLGNATWDKLAIYQKSQEPLEVTIQEVTRGGFLVATTDGLSGFLPYSHTTLGAGEGDGSQNLGKKLTVYVLELLRTANKIIFSQRPVVSTEDFQKIIGGLKKDEKMKVAVTNTTAFGIFVTVKTKGGAIDGLIHISELSWDKVTDISSLYQVGEEIEVVVIGFDNDAKRVDLSVKRLIADPNEEKLKVYSVDQQVTGVVTKLSPTGVAMELPNGVEGFIRKEKIPPTVTFAEGQEVQATIAQIDLKRKRVILVPVLAVKPLGYR